MLKLNPFRSALSLGAPFAEIQDGNLPCRICGVAVAAFTGMVFENVVIYGQANARGFSTDTRILVTRCLDCHNRRADAADILRAHPAIRRENGDVALDRLDGAMAVLDMLGRSIRFARNLAATDDGLRDLMTLASIGGWVSWSATFASAKVCSARRWSHIGNDLALDADAALNDLLKRRLEVPTDVVPPAGGDALRGCICCGIGAITGKLSNQRELWGEARRVPLSVLGGRGGETVTGFLCPPCRAALNAVGAIGLPVAWLSAIRFRGYEPRQLNTIVAIDGIRPWAVLRGAEPNLSRWAHINLAALDNELNFSTFVRRSSAA